MAKAASVEPSSTIEKERDHVGKKPAIVLVHGAFAESASWNPVIGRLLGEGFDVIAVANPLRSVEVDAAYVRDVIAGIGRPVVLVGHSYGGIVITEAAAGNDAVVELTYVSAFAPEHGESALELSGKFPGSTLPAALAAHPLSTGGNEFTITRGPSMSSSRLMSRPILPA